MKKKTALIIGISGQDGAYLARLLIDNGYLVVGTSRDAEMMRMSNLKFLGLVDQIQLISMVTVDFRSVFNTINIVQPNEIYNLSGQSSVGLSFTQPLETMESITLGTINLLEAIRLIDSDIKFYNAASSECFGDTQGEAAHEDTPFRPRSPYGVAKAAAYWQVANYREAYDIFSCSGILFNHESPLRPARFVTKKIVSAAHRIFRGSEEKLNLGNIDIQRDWGWAPDYVEAMWLMLQAPVANDFVVATGHSHSLMEFIELTFKEVGLDWRKHVVTDQGLIRPTDIAVSRGNASKAKDILNWEPKVHFNELIQRLVAAEFI